MSLLNTTTDINYNRYHIVAPKNTYSSNNNNNSSNNNNVNNDIIGLGAYGVVYKALDTLTNTYVALKKMKVESESDGISSSTLREITFLTQLKHDNIVKLRGNPSVRRSHCHYYHHNHHHNHQLSYIYLIIVIITFIITTLKNHHHHLSIIIYLNLLIDVQLLPARICLIFDLEDSDLSKHLSQLTNPLDRETVQVMYTSMATINVSTLLMMI